MALKAFASVFPRVDDSVYVDEQALVIGDVEIGKDSSIWPFAVIRGDVNKIRIGSMTNIQDHTVIHVTHDSDYNPGGYATLVGDEVTVGHRVTLHGCEIGSRCLIGMGATVMDGATVESHTIIAAGSLVTQTSHLESGYIWMGQPAKKYRPLTDEEVEQLAYSAQHYVKLKNKYLGN